MFKLPHQKWLEQQPKHTQDWLSKQACWYDIDLFKMFLVGVVVGLVIGLVF